MCWFHRSHVWYVLWGAISGDSKLKIICPSAAMERRQLSGTSWGSHSLVHKIMANPCWNFFKVELAYFSPNILSLNCVNIYFKMTKLMMRKFKFRKEISNLLKKLQKATPKSHQFRDLCHRNWSPKVSGEETVRVGWSVLLLAGRPSAVTQPPHALHNTLASVRCVSRARALVWKACGGIVVSFRVFWGI